MTAGRLDDYVTVAERIADFYEAYPAGRILTAILEHDREAGFVVVRAEVYRTAEDTMPSATGHAYEIRTESHVNKTSYIENGETSAVGRSLKLLGLETKRTPASKAASIPKGKALESAVIHGLRREIESVCKELYANEETRKTAMARLSGKSEQEMQEALAALNTQLAKKKERARLVEHMQAYFKFQKWDEGEQARFLHKKNLSSEKLSELSLDELIALTDECPMQQRKRA
ncbi:MAG TPA: hypothetical protein VGC91_07905 [Pyrinomonadaceae bacterium]|jgi:hypothetical protein